MMKNIMQMNEKQQHTTEKTARPVAFEKINFSSSAILIWGFGIIDIKV